MPHAAGNARRAALLACAILVAVPASGSGADPDPDADAGSEHAAYGGPVIDMHLHAFGWDRYGSEPPPNPVTGAVPKARGDEAAARAAFAELERAGAVKAVASGPLEKVRLWQGLAPELVVPGIYAERSEELPSVEELEALAGSGRIAVLGELAPQYVGGTLADAEWQPHLAAAERLDLPVAVHTGIGAPRTPYECCPEFRTALGRPGHLEEVLVRYPELRIVLLHAGMPWLEETLALLHVYPRVVVDVGAIDWALPREQLHRYLEALIDAGFEDRILFGSDAMIWPDAIPLAIEGVDSAPFLTPAQKRKIFHDNAARFLGLERDASP